NDALTHYNLALALKYKGESRQAVDEFENALHLKSSWAEAHFGLGATLLDLNDLSAARKELETAVKLDPKKPNAHRLLARVAAEQNDLALAQSELRLAMALKPTAETHFELGLVQGQLGNLPGAAAEFRGALALNPRYAKAQRMLGVTLRRQGDPAG